MVAVVTVCTEWMECQHTLIILVSKMCGQTRQKTFDVKLIRCCRCRHKSFGQSCQKLKFRVCRLPSEYGYIGEPLYSVFCKTVVKWHYIFAGPEITDGLQIGKSFVHNGDDIWCFCIAGRGFTAIRGGYLFSSVCRISIRFMNYHQLDTSHKSQDASVFAVGFDRTERIDSDMHRCHSHNRRIDHNPEGSKTDGGTS